MFFNGDLRSGITAALQQNKLVACFVRDDGAESRLWEEEFLRDPELLQSLAARTILLQLQAGSTEAGYLSEIYPLPKTPTMVLILKGELKEYLVSGITKHDFIRRMRAALEITPASVPIDANVVSAPQAVHGSNTPPDTEVAAPMDARIKAVLEERKLRLEKEKSEHDLKVKKHTEVAGQSGPKGEDARKYALAQSKRLTEAREERARVLQRIKEDKEHRREKDALRKEQLRASSMIQNEMAATASPTSPLQMKSPRSSQCAIQVRLFDGSTIRSSFGSGQTLRTHVRAWIDEHHDGDIPYTFRQVLTPSPNRFIGDSEEDQSLEDVGLCPSATLILIEVKAFAPAYNNGAAGLVKGGIAAGYGIVSSSINLFSGIVGGFLPVSSNQQPAERVLRSTPDARRPARDNTPDEQQEYYNGNSTNFAPRSENVDKQD